MSMQKDDPLVSEKKSGTNRIVKAPHYLSSFYELLSHILTHPPPSHTPYTIPQYSKMCENERATQYQYGA